YLHGEMLRKIIYFGAFTAYFFKKSKMDIQMLSSTNVSVNSDKY
uniref:Uncharacterized protein n=1 Tax=Aegilops tauschii subsp. strangulata TaxID=200361 RepID=A0A453LNU1_AEGTS